MKVLYPIRLVGTGLYLPASERTNADFASYLDTSDEWIVTRTGIRSRRYAAPDECTSTMATLAARQALEEAKLLGRDLGAIICATATGDHQFPATATIVQGALEAGCVPAFDIGAACAGFLFGLNMAGSLVGGGSVPRAMVLGAETLSRFVDREDRSTAVLFGDAAGAAIVDRAIEADQGIVFSELGCDGSRHDHIRVPAGGARLPTSSTTVAERLHFLKMKGREVYKFAVVKMMELIDRALESSGLTPDDLKLVIPHQSNLRILESVREKLRLPREKLVTNIDRFGNTSAASVIIGLHEARRSGQLQRGDLVMMIALGAGLVWGIVIVRL